MCTVVCTMGCLRVAVFISIKYIVYFPLLFSHSLSLSCSLLFPFFLLSVFFFPFPFSPSFLVLFFLFLLSFPPSFPFRFLSPLSDFKCRGGGTLRMNCYTALAAKLGNSCNFGRNSQQMDFYTDTNYTLILRFKVTRFRGDKFKDLKKIRFSSLNCVR